MKTWLARDKRVMRLTSYLASTALINVENVKYTRNLVPSSV